MRHPLIGVRRDRGSRYLLLTIASFAVTVMAVRVYLDSAGYPKVGGGGLHVAHMLWGGLLLVVAALLPQVFVGRRALILSSLAAGIGVGLFIDEVGKFITESNDYFFAPAAPIIYGAALLLVLVWLRVRRDDRPSLAEATQGAIEAVRDLADGRLSATDRDRAVTRLRAAGAAPGATDLSGELLEMLGSSATTARLAQPGWVERGDARALGPPAAAGSAGEVAHPDRPVPLRAHGGDGRAARHRRPVRRGDVHPRGSRSAPSSTPPSPSGCCCSGSCGSPSAWPTG